MKIKDLIVIGTDRKGKYFTGHCTKGKAQNLINSGVATLIKEKTIVKHYHYDTIRPQILLRDSYTCHYCGKHGDTVDHVVPRAKGGLTKPDKLVCACRACNEKNVVKTINLL